MKCTDRNPGTLEMGARTLTLCGWQSIEISMKITFSDISGSSLKLFVYYSHFKAVQLCIMNAVVNP